MRHPLIKKLQSGRTLAGMQCFSASPPMVEAMGYAGLDFAIIDLEHCPTTLEAAAHLCRAADNSGLAPLVRVPSLDASLIGRILDTGAHGIVVPHASPDVARLAVEASRLPPAGTRGACPIVRAARYGAMEWPAFVEQQNARTLIIPLIEDVAAVDDAARILDVDGVEIVFVGPFDLSISAGLAGKDYRDDRMRQMLDHIVREASLRQKYVMTTVGATIDEGYAADLLQSGVKLLSFSADLAVFLAACKRVARLAPGGANAAGVEA